MRLLRRILLTVAVSLAVVFVGLNWIAPVALSFYAAKKAPPVTRVIPAELKDKSVSEVPGKKLSYFGYEFEIPWSDLDETQTKLYPSDKTEKCKVDLRFRSGLRLVFTAIPPREWANGFATDMKVSPQVIESAFGNETMKSDYNFVKHLYEFTPDKMNHWAASPQVHYQEQYLLIFKSVALPKSAETGIFNLHNASYEGFQQGNPQARQDGIIVDLYSDEGSVEVIFFQKNCRNSAGVTQPEINRMVQSLHKATQGELTGPRIAIR